MTQFLGFTIGRNFANNSVEYIWFPDVIKRVTGSTDKMMSFITKNSTAANISDIVSQYSGFVPTPEELDAITNVRKIV